MKKDQKSILIVDDDKSILRMFSRILEKAGYTVDTAETGQETTEKLGSQTYDIALVDIKLPDTNGTDLLPKMHVLYPQMIKIAITGFPSLEDGTKVLNGGADAYLVKPVKPEELLKIIEEKLKNREKP